MNKDMKKIFIRTLGWPYAALLQYDFKISQGAV
jgi:hypothetical protein